MCTTRRRLSYAAGYIQLGLLNEASHELEGIAFEDRLSAAVLAVRLDLHTTAKHWDIAAGVAMELIGLDPANVRAWLGRASALKELGRLPEAKATLLEAEPLHGGRSARLHYDLARYHCLLGEVALARARLQEACTREAHFKEAALDDPDLGTLWE
jgi:tetratricopeptide (TPR) repeat protein